MLELQSAARSQRGARSHNEDDVRQGRHAALAYAVVCDGAGGHRGGAAASDIVGRTTALGLQSTHQFSAPALEAIVAQAHHTLNGHQQGLRNHHRMHSTVVALWLDLQQQRAVWAHCGDSRLYLLRNGRVQQLTRDDSLVQQMLDIGLIKLEQGPGHAGRNQLVAALGMEEQISIHVCQQPLALHDGDAFLLCTDGWWNAMQPQEMEAALATSTDPGDWLDRMAELVPSRRLKNQDNYSAVGVWVGDPTQSTRAAPL
jgi:PPM family protein phosphatase